MNDRLDTAGFTLLETMIALAILAIALMGTLGGFITVDTQLKDAQLRQGKMVLLDAKVQRVLLTNKAELTGIPAAWTPDPTQSIVNANNTPTPRPVPDPDIDLSVGAYFSVLPNGEITQINLPAGTPLGSRSEEHTSELQSPDHLVCRLLLEKKKNKSTQQSQHIQPCRTTSKTTTNLIMHTHHWNLTTSATTLPDINLRTNNMTHNTSTKSTT